MPRYPFVLLTLFSVQAVHAQILTDTTFVWQGYAQLGTTRVQVYRNPSNEEKPFTLLLKELAENKGPSIVSEVSYLAEEIGRKFGFDPAKATWVLHWGAFSFAEARNSKKELFLRATFKRTKRRQLSSPQWRVIQRDDVEALTDRIFR